MKKAIIILFVFTVTLCNAQKADTNYLNSKLKGLIDNYNKVAQKADTLTKQLQQCQKQLQTIEGAIQMVAILKDEQTPKKPAK